MSFNDDAFLLKRNKLSADDLDKILKLCVHAFCYLEMIENEIHTINEFISKHPDATASHPRLWGMYDELDSYENSYSAILEDIEKIVNGD